MTNREALMAMTHHLALATDEEISAALACLRQGAGWISIDNGVPTEPAGLSRDRRWLWLACAEAISYCGPWDAEWVPVFAGDWEIVLATLIVNDAWPKIYATAQDLRANAN